MEQYSTNLTDKQWQVIENIINPQGKKRKKTLRGIMDAIFYTLKTGCQWCMLPKNFTSWQSVYYDFCKRKNEGLIEELLDIIRSKVRRFSGRQELPSVGIIDSRSVKISHHVDTVRGLDGNKKIKGRKQYIIVGTQGNLMSIKVHEANVHDSKGAPGVINNLEYKFPRLAKIIADGGCRGELADWVLQKFRWTLDVVLRPDECPTKFKVLPKRWIVERAFAWLENFRRLTIDYEFHADRAEAMVQLACCKTMLNKIIE